MDAIQEAYDRMMEKGSGKYPEDDKDMKAEKGDEKSDDDKEMDEAVDAKAIVKELIDTSFGGSNESQMKAVQLLKGLATSDDPAANAFMKKLDSWTSGLKNSGE